MYQQTHSLQQRQGEIIDLVPFREEVVLDRSTQQKQKLLIEVEVLRSRWQQCQIESNHLKEE